MGVGPYINVVCGLKYSDALHRDKVELGTEPTVPALIDGGFNLLTREYGGLSDTDLYEIFCYGPPMSASPTHPSDVIGYMVSQVGDTVLTRALFALWEVKVMGGKELYYQEYLLPQEPDPGSDCRLWAARRQGKHVLGIVEHAIAEERMYSYLSGWRGNVNSDRWFKCALHILHHVGFTQVERGDLQTYLVMGWE